MREKTNLTIHPSIKNESKKLAKEEDRSLSELVERLLEKFIQEQRARGYAEMEKGKNIMKSSKRKKN